MELWQEGRVLSDERTDDAAQDQLAAEEITQDEDAIEQDEHPIDLDTEEPTPKKKLKRILDQQALTRMEKAARTEDEFQELVQWWDRLDENRRRRERYHEVLRSGDEFPLEYGASPHAATFPNTLNHVLDKQIRQGDFIDAIYSCPYEIQELVTDENLSIALNRLNEEQREILFHIVIQEFSASRTAEIMGKSDRNIRKVRLTIISKICRTYSDLTGLEKRLKENPSVRLTEHERYVLSVLNMNIGMMRGNQKKSNSGKKKGKKKNRPGRSGSK